MMHILVIVCKISFCFNFLQIEYNQSLKVAQVARRNAVYKYGLSSDLMSSASEVSLPVLEDVKICSPL